MKKKDKFDLDENLEDFSFDGQPKGEEPSQQEAQPEEQGQPELHESADAQENTCECEKNCDCGEDCQCQDGECGENCTCEEHCECEEHGHHHHGHKHEDLAAEYLAMAQRLQADFDNYRRRVAEQLDYQRQEGVKSVLDVFLPCLDTFKEAKKSISDEQVLSGVNMIEEKILSALKTLKVEKIESVGKVYDPHLHNAIAVMRDESKDADVILEEYQSGWKLGDKVIKYAQVVVNKLD